MPLGVEYRYYDHPMPGSIYTAPDILNVVRGRVHDRSQPMRVPAQIKATKAASNVHDREHGDNQTMLLRRILAGIDPSYKREQERPSIDFHRRADEMFNVRPREQPLR